MFARSLQRNFAENCSKEEKSLHDKCFSGLLESQLQNKLDNGDNGNGSGNGEGNGEGTGANGSGNGDGNGANGNLNGSNDPNRNGFASSPSDSSGNGSNSSGSNGPDGKPLQEDNADTHSDPIAMKPGATGEESSESDLEKKLNEAPDEIDRTDNIAIEIDMLSDKHSPSPDPDNEWLDVLDEILIKTDKIDPNVFFNFPPAIPTKEIKLAQKDSQVDPITKAGFSSDYTPYWIDDEQAEVLMQAQLKEMQESTVPNSSEDNSNESSSKYSMERSGKELNEENSSNSSNSSSNSEFSSSNSNSQTENESSQVNQS